MEDYFTELSLQLGIPIWTVIMIFLVLAIWSAVWKLLAMWRAARLRSVHWFIALGIINTLGILEILYLFIFSEMGRKKPRFEKPKKVEASKTKKKVNKKK